MILGVRISNYDVFEDETIGITSGEVKSGDNRLRNVNALIGRNNTGKTSFMMAMSFIKRCLNSDVAAASKADGRPGFSNLIMDKSRNAVFCLYFKIKNDKENGAVFLRYELEIAATKFGSPTVASEKVTRVHRSGSEDELLSLNKGSGIIINGDGTSSPAQISDEHLTGLSVYGKISLYRELAMLYKEIDGWFFCRFSSENTNKYYSDGNAPGGHRHLSSSGANVNNVLEYMESEDPERFVRMMADIKGMIPAMKTKKTLPKNLDSSPDKLFLYLLLLRENQPHTTIFIETPDRDLYHDMVDVLANDMRDFSFAHPYNQIIFTTHNPYIIENMAPSEVWIFRREYGEEEDSNLSVRCAASDAVIEALSAEGVGMGAIWYGGHLDGDDVPPFGDN